MARRAEIIQSPEDTAVASQQVPVGQTRGRQLPRYLVKTDQSSVVGLSYCAEATPLNYV